MLSIKVGYADVHVLPMDRTLSLQCDAVGLYSHTNHTIYIRRDHPPAEQAATLIHELIHACWAVFNMTRRKLDEEGVCQALEGPLATLFRDNPCLPALLHQATANGQPIVS